MKTIILTGGSTALVDDKHFDMLNKYTWLLNNKGYAQRSIYNEGTLRTTFIHREVMGAKKGQIVDHINGNPLDNRRSNLRFCTQAENCRNQKLSSNNTSGYKGVHLIGKKWRAMIMVDGKNIHLGMYATAEEAARAYDNTATVEHGEFAKLNL